MPLFPFFMKRRSEEFKLISSCDTLSMRGFYGAAITEKGRNDRVGFATFKKDDVVLGGSKFAFETCEFDDELVGGGKS